MAAMTGPTNHVFVISFLSLPAYHRYHLLVSVPDATHDSGEMSQKYVSCGRDWTLKENDRLSMESRTASARLFSR